MIIRKAIVISILVMLGITCAGGVLALYNSVRASVQSYPEVLSNIPSGYPFVFGINVQQLIKSSAFAKLQQNKQVAGDLQSFIDKTGLDPKRDIFYMVGAGRPGGTARNEGLVIVVGQFDKDRIISYVRAKSAVIEKEYAGASILMIPEAKSDGAPEKGIVILNERKIALGDLESLKAVLDIGGREDKSILANETITALIRSINPDEMFWFAGDAGSVLSRAPANLPLSQNASSIRSLVGTFSISDAVTGKITAVAINTDSAVKLAEGIKGLISLAQLSGNQNPELKALLGGLAISQNSTEVTLGLNLPPELLDKLTQSRKIPTGPTTH